MFSFGRGAREHDQGGILSMGCDLHAHAHAQEGLNNSMFLEQMGTA